MMNLNEILADSPSESKETVTKVKETVKKQKSVAKKTSSDSKPKKKGKPRGKGANSPVIGNNGLNLDEGDNTKYLSVNLALMNMPNIDMTNESEVQQRLSDYFALYAQADMKPTVAGMAIALNGHNRQWLWAVTHNAPLGGRGNECTLPRAVTNVIKKAYLLLENLWENYMQNGKVNPVAGIFLGKNNYGYQDKTETILTPNTQQESYSPSDIRARYIDSTTPKQIDMSDSNDSDE